ncbi:MAG TPA: signal peptidase II [bacterium]|nr:signal peptidase II [bacterium]
MMALAGVSLLVLSLDQLTKFMVLRTMELNESVPLLPKYLYFTYTQNPGSAFGFMAQMDALVRIPLFIVATLGATAIVYMYQRMLPHDRWATRVALGLVWGGALGNLVDRVLYGKVVDFIDMRFEDYQWFPYIFNLADACITIGLGYLLYEFLSSRRQKASA